MQELKVLAGGIYGTNLMWKILSESDTIRRTARKCHNQKNIKKKQQSKACPGCVTIKRSSSECRNYWYCQAVLQKVHPGMLQLKVRQGSVAIISTARECHNLSTLGNVTIKSTTRDRHNQKYCHGLQQSKIMPGSAAINISRECNKQKYSKEV